ncbi:lysozyme inhibitor LprI family protein [Saccharibacillus alkalitolerans]|uniref:DUF1311 domain-containing protein n=1 Tax=Saccharibacillus alkalitolerans TaxID=2705290 RepID=A0ABX0FB69_9BACL|nr:lysozyme inhibitor LprI family protein [Saccharibacillus alkalitolerans]NGZ76788.1 DUF1311 domain-containing protein [Saccharibacillus alkalitolerans]
MALNKWTAAWIALIFMLPLTACGSADSKGAESRIIGSWKIFIGDEPHAYLEIGPERLISTVGSDDPITAEYTFTETEGGHIILEVFNPETRKNELFFEGYFEDKNTIDVVNTPSGPVEDSRLIRVDVSADKQKELEDKSAIVEQPAKDETQDEAQVEAKSEQAEPKDAEGTGLKSRYASKADRLDQTITEEAKRLFAHDTQPGFYGGYYEDWDNLLQEIWNELKATMPSVEFEKLKAEQIEWIKRKEKHFNEFDDTVASERAAGMDDLAAETKDRVYDLIEHYME